MVTTSSTKCFILPVLILLCLQVTLAQCEKYDESKENLQIKKISDLSENVEERLIKSRKLYVRPCKEELGPDGKYYYCCIVSKPPTCYLASFGQSFCDERCHQQTR